MKNNLDTNIFKRFWSYISKARYEKNLKYTEYKKSSPVWKYRILKVGALISFYGIGHYFIYKNKVTKDDFHIVEQINDIVNSNLSKNTNLDKFINEIRNHTANFYDIKIVNDKESNFIRDIARSLDPKAEKYIKVMRVNKLLSEEELKNEATETIQKLEYFFII